MGTVLDRGMGKRYEDYGVAFKLRVVQDYKRGVPGHGAQAVAKKWKVTGGKKLVRLWAAQYDGTRESLRKHTHPNRPRLLSPQQADAHIGAVARDRQQQHRAIDYARITSEVQRRTGTAVSYATVKRYGHDSLNLRQRRTKVKQPRECILLSTSNPCSC
jgi:transposase